MKQIHTTFLIPPSGKDRNTQNAFFQKVQKMRFRDQTFHFFKFFSSKLLFSIVEICDRFGSNKLSLTKLNVGANLCHSFSFLVTYDFCFSFAQSMNTN